MAKAVLLFSLFTTTSLVQGSLFGASTCQLLKPLDPECCFMTDSEHSRSQGSAPLSNSPFMMNLVTAKGKSLNKFEKTTLNNNNMWRLTPLKEDPNNPGNEIPGGPIRLQLATTDECFDQFWVQGHKLIMKTQETVLSGSFIEEPGVAEYPHQKTNGDRNNVGCDTRLFGKNTEATIVSPTSICQREIGLSWTPPPKCTQDQIRNGATHLCRQEEDVYFFTFTTGNSQKSRYYIGQNTFGFHVTHNVD